MILSLNVCYDDQDKGVETKGFFDPPLKKDANAFKTVQE